MAALDFEILGLAPYATLAQIKRAYRKMALIHHPDKNPGKSDTKFKEILDAYERLMDQKLRASPGKFEDYQDLDKDFSDADDNTLEEVFYARIGKNKTRRWVPWVDADYHQNGKLYTQIWPVSTDCYGAEINLSVKNLSNKNISEKTWNKVKKIFFYSEYTEDQDDLSLLKRGAKFLKYCGHYFTDFFQPYASPQDKKKDFFSVWKGIKNIGLGMLKWFGVVLILLLVVPFNAIRNCFEKRSPREKKRSFGKFLEDVGFDYGFKTTLKDAMGYTLSGISVFVMIPVTYFLKIPLRSLISVFKKPKNMEESPKIQRYVAESEAALVRDDKNAIVIILKVLHHKYKKDLAEGRQSDIAPDMEKKMYRDVKKHTIAGTLHRCSKAPTINDRQGQTVRKYLSLFKSKTESPETQIREAEGLELLF